MTSKQLVEEVVKGMQEQKAKRITVIDLRKLEAPCEYFVLCEGTSSVHVSSIATTLRRYVREQVKAHPFAVDGLDNASWVAMDYGQVIVHIFLRETREFYDIEHLWADAKLTDIPDLD